MSEERQCKECGKNIAHKKSVAKFCDQSCLYKTWYRENKEKKIEYTKEYTKNNREKSRIWADKWQKNNIEKVKAYKEARKKRVAEQKSKVRKFKNIKTGNVVEAVSLGRKGVEVYKFSVLLNKIVVDVEGNNCFYRRHKEL